MRTRAHARGRAKIILDKMKENRILNILIACEESQAETNAFRLLGHNAFSCDLVPCKEDTDTDTHIITDCLKLFHTPCRFVTQAGNHYTVDHWDLIVSHPPCTYLCIMSASRMYRKGKVQKERYMKMLEARKFFFQCLNAPAKYVAVENPQPLKCAQLPRPSFFIQPFWFGHKYSKKTLYWVKNLPPLISNIIHPNPKPYIKVSRGKDRSRTFTGVAQAMAEQWTEYILKDKQ